MFKSEQAKNLFYMKNIEPSNIQLRPHKNAAMQILTIPNYLRERFLTATVFLVPRRVRALVRVR